ncbi:MAG TPA: GlsB/YeaQ/YmgE family stress response membrane protein [Actinomycetota bacterium]|nr:GlsB/YeaQ/YmgE family stress response membrane protein [Actinomycetota bacterium]
MEIVWLVVTGLVIGIIARLILPGRDPIGLLGTLVVGVVGALIGGYLWKAAGFGDTGGTEMIGGIIAAVALLFVYRRIAVGRGTA